jgi:hypothetical protein
MKVSDLVDRLQVLQSKHGDIEVHLWIDGHIIAPLEKVVEFRGEIHLEEERE